MKRLIFILTFIFTCKLAFCQWAVLTSGTTVDLRGVWFTDNITGYAVGSNGTILKTVDGVSWSPLTSNTTENLMSVYFVSNNIGFACGNNRIILKTTDAGLNWTSQNFGCCVLYEVFFIDQSNGYVSGYGGICLKTTDGGISWNSLNLGTTNAKISLFFTGIDTGYVVGDGLTDAIMKTTDAVYVFKLICTYA